MTEHNDLGKTENPLATLAGSTARTGAPRDATDASGLAQGVIDVYAHALVIAQRNAWVDGYIHRRSRKWNAQAMAEKYYPLPDAMPLNTAEDVLRLVDAFGFAVGSGGGEEAEIRAAIVAALGAMMLTERASVPAFDRSRSSPQNALTPSPARPHQRTRRHMRETIRTNHGALIPPPPKPKRTCNRHDDCDAADAAARARNRWAEHCHDDGCEDCFGS